MTENPPIVFCDCETDGLGPDRRPWEIAVVRRAPDGTETEHHWFLPINAARADGFALRLGGFWDRHPGGRTAAAGFRDGGSLVLSDDGVLGWRGAPRPEVVAADLMSLTHGAIWVGANPAFDAELVDRLLREHGLQPTWNYHLVDTGTLMLGFLHSRAAAGWGDPPPATYRSDDLAKAIGVEPATDADRHTALGDARWCQRIYDRVTGRAAAVAS
jgi:hypothetical protein